MYLLEREALVPAPRDEVFAFFHDPRNLTRITPKSLGFTITQIDELPVRAGFQISYRIRPLVVPLSWTTTITEWDPPNGFGDVQTKGPYKAWHHRHTFEETDGGTLMRDRVQYELPFGILGTIAHRLIVAPQLKRIFDYRARRIRSSSRGRRNRRPPESYEYARRTPMTTEQAHSEPLAAARRLADIASQVAESAVASASRLTDGGKGIDDHQAHVERIAQMATEARAARELTAYAESQANGGSPDPLADEEALIFAAEALHKARNTIESDPDTFAIDNSLRDTLSGDEVRALIRSGMSIERIAALGAHVIAARGAFTAELDDEIANMTRDHAREFARSEVAPIAQEMHRQDHLVPEDLIKKMAGIGLFGSSIPESYGGTEMGLLTMVVLTEELSTVSLVAGSLITRSEILTRALLAGGTEEQRQTWLPPIGSGELLVGIAVTEPDVGSDVASLTCKAVPAERDGKQGWVIDGPKAWSTFAGRANILALLARTGEAGSGAKGLSLFIVPKEPYDGHHFEHTQPEGGSISGTANPTPGYRGMHSFTLAIDNYFVPPENLVGGEEGLGRGFHLQMGGFAAGRLQTGARATGVSQASLEKACAYASDRKQFGNPLADYQLTQYKIGRMASHAAAGRHLTYAAAKAMEEDESASLEAAMCKLFASDVAVWVSQEGMLIHGGWGYSEEDPIARFTVDALVLPIFEGVKPILELKVIGRQLLAG